MSMVSGSEPLGISFGNYMSFTVSQSVKTGLSSRNRRRDLLPHRGQLSGRLNERELQHNTLLIQPAVRTYKHPNKKL